MSNMSPSLTTALADRYRIERELGQGGMVRRSGLASHCGDTSRVAAIDANRQIKDSQQTTVL